MGYFFILFAVLCNTVKGYASKRVSGDLQTVRKSISFNIARNAICCLFAFLFVLIENVKGLFNITPQETIICAVSGIAMAVFTCAWILALKTDAYMLVSACASASFSVPCIFGLAFLGEVFTVCKFTAFIMILCALYFLLRYNFSLKGKLGKRQILLLGLILISQGITQTMQKLYNVYIPDKETACYTLYMFVVSFAVLLPILPFYKKEKTNGEGSVIKNNTVYIIIMGLSLFASSYFQTVAAKSIDTIVMYPLLNVLNLIGGSIMASLLFKEKMTRDSIIGIILVFCALMFSKF